MRASPPAASRWLLAPLLLLVVAPGKAADGDATAAAAAACSFDEFMLDLEDGTLGPDQREACEAFLHLMPEPLGNMVVKGACRGEQRCEWVALLRHIESIESNEIPLDSQLVRECLAVAASVRRAQCASTGEPDAGTGDAIAWPTAQRGDTLAHGTYSIPRSEPLELLTLGEPN
jgi:hypothetical protein